MSAKNTGTGVAFNTWGLLTIKGLPIVYHAVQTYFLVPNTEASVLFTSVGDVLYPTNIFESHIVYPSKEKTDGIDADVRLMLTYNDIFNNKYLTIFDHSNEFGWRLVSLQEVNTRLDELAIKKKTQNT